MRLKVICVGKSKGPFQDLSALYQKRIGRYAQVEVIEIPEVRYTGDPHRKEREKILGEEGNRIVAKLEPRDHIVALDAGGKSFSSEAFAAYLRGLANDRKADVAFAIGGSLGLDPAIKSRADLCLSLSSFTLPHLLARVVLLEQAYRAFTIQRGEPYHK